MQYDGNSDTYYDDGQPDQSASDFAVMPDQGYPPASDFAVMPQGMTMQEPLPPVMMPEPRRSDTAEDYAAWRALYPDARSAFWGDKPPSPPPPPQLDPNYNPYPPSPTFYDPEQPPPPPVTKMPDPYYNPYPQPPTFYDPEQPPGPGPMIKMPDPNYNPYYNPYEQYVVPVMPSGYDNQSTGIPVMPSGYPPSRAKYDPGMLAGLSSLVSALSGMTGNRTPSGGSTPGYGQQLPPRLVRP
jgi:hypothetical protein